MEEFICPTRGTRVGAVGKTIAKKELNDIRINVERRSI